MEKYREVADFLTIYIKEAHAQDQWPLGRHVRVTHHTNLSERIAVAKLFVEHNDYKIKVVVDNMQDDFTNTYFAHPERFYVFQNGLLTFKAFPEGAYYTFNGLIEHLEKM